MFVSLLVGNSRATSFLSRYNVIQMDPNISSKLCTFIYRNCLMHRSEILFNRIRVENTWPKKSSSFLGADHKIVLALRLCISNMQSSSSALFNIREVKVESQNTWTTGSLCLVFYVIMMSTIKLSFFITKHLKVFKISSFNIGNICDPLHDTLRDRVMPTTTFIIAPSIFTGAPLAFHRTIRSVSSQFSNILTPLVTVLVPKLD
mmetsp:Transcript_28711/g.43893  ORF Transcript_28711/g.43893 Transcript_28711/m.43893 type:complete len:204 (-) Transcript_28711:1124-1735(-)